MMQAEGMKQALKLLAQREYSRRLLRDKLMVKGIDKNCCEKILNELEDKNFLSDRRFAETFVRDAASKCRGPIRISSELEAKGVSREFINQALSQIDNWKALAIQSARKKISFDDLADCYESSQFDLLMQEKRKKVSSHLAYQGFDYDLCQDVVDTLEQEYSVY